MGLPDIVHITAAVATDCTAGCDLSLPKAAANERSVAILVRIVFGIIGAISVFFTVYGGFRFIISNGDPGEANKARQTIIYAIAGLAIAVLAEGIVGFVLKAL